MSLDLQSLIDPAITIAREAGEIIMEYYEGGHAREMVKSDNAAVTDADLASDALITKKLSALTPNIPVVTEEGVEAGNIPDVSNGTYWVCDPLDGTLSFTKKMNTFCVFIALIDNKESVIGICHYPVRNETYYAMKSHGAHFIRHHANKTETLIIPSMKREQPLVASHPVYNDVNKLDICFAHLPKENRLWREDIDMNNLFSGEIDMIVFTVTGGGEWDLAATEIILKEAGGDIVQMFDTPKTLYGNPTQKITPKAFLGSPDLQYFLKPPKL